MNKFFAFAVETFAAMQRSRAHAQVLERLDERTLRDIGLEHEANRARARSRQLYMRFGTY